MYDLSVTKADNGIEFYVSNDGEETGMSMAGLARCCGVHHTSIIKFISTSGSVTSASYKILKPFNGKIFVGEEGCDLDTENKAKVVRAEVCAAIISYYAFQSKNTKNDVAKETLMKFSAIGINNWIKQLTGFNESEKIIIDKLSLIFDELQELKELAPLAKNYIKVKDGVKTDFPGLTNILEDIEDKKEPKLLPGTKMTLSDWLLTKKVKLTNGGYCAFGRMVSETYKSMKQQEPNKGNRKKSNGKWSMNVRLYGENDFPILEAAFKQFVVAL